MEQHLSRETECLKLDKRVQVDFLPQANTDRK